MKPDVLPIHERFGLTFEQRSKPKPNTKKYYGGNDSEVRKEILPAHQMIPWSWFFLIVSVIWVVVSLCLDVFEVKEKYYFFQRSGVILVIASLWVEWLTSRTPLNGRMTMSLGVFPTTRYAFIRSLFAKIGLFTAVTGTFIWAYGDTPF